MSQPLACLKQVFDADENSPCCQIKRSAAWSLTSVAELFSASYIAVREKLRRLTSTSPATTWLFSSQRLIPSSTKRENLTEQLQIFLYLESIFFSF